MTVTVKLYRYGMLWGSGTGTAGSASVTSYTGVDPGSVKKAVQVTLTTSAATPTDVGATYSTRVVTSSAGTLTLKDALPFS